MEREEDICLRDWELLVSLCKFHTFIADFWTGSFSYVFDRHSVISRILCLSPCCEKLNLLLSVYQTAVKALCLSDFLDDFLPALSRSCSHNPSLTFTGINLYRNKLISEISRFLVLVYWHMIWTNKLKLTVFSCVWNALQEKLRNVRPSGSHFSSDFLMQIIRAHHTGPSDTFRPVHADNSMTTFLERKPASDIIVGCKPLSEKPRKKAWEHARPFFLARLQS